MNTHTLTINDVAEKLQISVPTLRYRLRHRGIYAAIKVGRRFYFSEAVYNSPLALRG